MALMNRIQANYRFVIGFNGALIGLGVTGILSPAASAMLHNLSTLGVSLHSMSTLPAALRTAAVKNGCGAAADREGFIASPPSAE